MHVFVEVRVPTSAVVPKVLSTLVFQRQDLSLANNSPHRLDWLDTNPRDQYVSAAPILGFQPHIPPHLAVFKNGFWPQAYKVRT